MENYRPISLLCLAMKIFEKCVRTELMSYATDLLDARQHGFRNRKSCTTQLVHFADSLAITLNKSERSDVIYFDFAKAFDTVNHDLILHKLKHSFHIDGVLLKFVTSYLKDRTQKVVVGGSCSSIVSVQSGVPQGSILGPLLFIMFINDMITSVSTGTDIALYADDTKIWRTINCWEDHILLQKDITALYEWSVKNKMTFHPSKCVVLPVTLKNVQYILPFDRFAYHLNNEILDYKDSQKDLGINVTTRLLWTSHCKSITTKASSRLGLLRRTLHFTKCKKQKRILYFCDIASLYSWGPSWIDTSPKESCQVDIV